MLEVPIFVINLYHRGPYFGEPGAKVLRMICLSTMLVSSFQLYGVKGTVSGFSAIDYNHGRESLGDPQHCHGTAAQNHNEYGRQTKS